MLRFLLDLLDKEGGHSRAKEMKKIDRKKLRIEMLKKTLPLFLILSLAFFPTPLMAQKTEAVAPKNKPTAGMTGIVNLNGIPSEGNLEIHKGLNGKIEIVNDPLVDNILNNITKNMRKDGLLNDFGNDARGTIGSDLLVNHNQEFRNRDGRASDRPGNTLGDTMKELFDSSNQAGLSEGGAVGPRTVERSNSPGNDSLKNVGPGPTGSNRLHNTGTGEFGAVFLRNGRSTYGPDGNSGGSSIQNAGYHTDSNIMSAGMTITANNSMPTFLSNDATRSITSNVAASALFEKSSIAQQITTGFLKSADIKSGKESAKKSK